MIRITLLAVFLSAANFCHAQERLLAPGSQTAGPKDGASAALQSVQYLPANNLTQFSVIGQSNQSGDDRKNVFSLDDGVVVADQTPGHFLVTNAEYEDYKLEIEYRWTTKDAKRDSGIFVNVKGSKANEPLAPGEKMRGIEVNLLGPERWKQKSWSGLVWLYSPSRDPVELTVGGTVHRRGTASSAPQDYERSYGEWNSVEITNANHRFLVKLNGNVVAQGTNPLPSAGKIALQSGGIEFRRMVVTPLAVRDVKSRAANSASIPKPSTGSVEQASALAKSGDRTAAAEMLEQLFAADPSAMDTLSGLGLATLYAASGQKDQHRQFCERFQQKFSDWKLPTDAERPAKAYLLFPGADDAEMLKNADAATRHAVAQGRGGMRVWFELSRGMAQYRLGDYAGAAESLRSPLQGNHPAQRIEAHAFAAMAAYQTGQVVNARQLLTAAKDEFNRADRAKLNWSDLIASRIAIDEAEALFNPQAPMSPNATDSSSTSPVSNQAGLNVYGNVPGLAPSDKYRFRVRTAKGKWQEPFAFITTCKKGDGHKTNNYFGHLSGWSNTYINFEMSRPVEIAIGKSNGQPIRKAAAHPKHKVASCTVRGGLAYVVMNEPGLIAVDIDGQMDDQDTGKGYKGPPIHTVTVFANPFLKNRPQMDDPNVYFVKPGEEAPRFGLWKTLYFLPGVHDIGVGYPLRANTDYYIPGDAIVYGTMNNLANRTEGHDIRIFGHGTLSGARIAHPRFASPQPKDHKMHNSIRIIDASDTAVDGITLADSAHHTLQMQNRKDPTAMTDLRWVKVFTWRGNGDGVGAGANGSMEDCFMRCQDDCTYVMPGRPTRRVTFWNDYNGSAFVLSGLPGEEKIVEDCDVIYARAGWHHWSGGRTFNMRGAGYGPCGEGVIFRNIRISDPRPTLQHFMIAMQNFSPYGDPKKNKRGAGDLSGVLFQNIKIAAPSVLREPEVLWGMPDGMIRSITFDNVTIDGKKLKSLRDFKHNEYVKDFTFK